MTDSANINDRIEQARTELANLAQEARDLESQAGGTDLVVSSNDPLSVKNQAKQLRIALVKKQREMKEKHAELERVVQEKNDILRRELEQKMALEREAANALMEQLKPMQEVVKRLEEGIYTINLFFGRDEEILTLREGKPASDTTAITIRQRVLSMDEETAAAAATGGSDARHLEEFDAWLTANPEHLDQVLPEEKGIVALVPRFKNMDHIDKKEMDPWSLSNLEKANKQTYFLIRNGENLYRTWTDFNVGRNLIPRADEFTTFFENVDREGRKSILAPGSEEYEEALDKSDARQRHFMRVAMILEGLLRRTAVFHPVHPDTSFLDPLSHRAGHVRFITDMEKQLETGRPSFAKWQQDIMEKARVGMRVAGLFTKFGESGVHHRPRYTDPPEPGKIYTLDAVEDGYWVVRYDPSKRSFQTKRSSVIFPKNYRRAIVVDLASLDDMEYYLGSRSNRHEYVDMFPVLQSAIAAKKAEAEQEKPFKQMLVGVLARENGVDPSDLTPDVIDDLCQWYKLSAKYHKPLLFEDPPEINEDLYDDVTGQLITGFSERKGTNTLNWSPTQNIKHVKAEREKRVRSLRLQESKAVKQIVAEHKTRLGLAQKEAEGKGFAVGDPVKFIRTFVEQVEDGELLKDYLVKHVLLIGLRKSDGRYVAYLPARESENIFIHEVEFNRHGRPFTPNTTSKGGRFWSVPGTRPERSYEVLYTSDRWAKWDRKANPNDHLTDPEFLQLEAEVKTKAESSPLRGLRRHDRDKHPRPLAVWREMKHGNQHWCVAYFLDGGQTPEVRLLTREAEAPTLYIEDYSWAKGRNGVELDHRRSNSWDNVTALDKIEDADILRKDEGVMADFEKARAHWKNYQAEVEKLEEKVEWAIGAIKQAWLDRAWWHARSRFLEDYGDEDLWADHKKSVKISYPYDHHYSRRRYYRHRRDVEPDLHGLLTRLVEDGVKLHGKTVKQLVEMAGDHAVKVEDLKVPEDLLYLELPKEKVEEPAEVK